MRNPFNAYCGWLLIYSDMDLALTFSSAFTSVGGGIAAPIVGRNTHRNELLEYKLFRKGSFKLLEYIIPYQHLTGRCFCHATHA